MQTIMEFLSIVYISLFLFSNFVIAKKKPNIVLIVADDLGYNDVSWHNPDIISPNLAKLAEKGIILENHYVQPICTPTRSALMTGYYPIHTGRQVCKLCLFHCNALDRQKAKLLMTDALSFYVTKLIWT